MSREDTILLYVVNYLFSVLMLAFSQTKRGDKLSGYRYNFNFVPFIISFFPLWVLSCFTNIGADYDNYYNIIASSDYYLKEMGVIECVFYFLCNILYRFFNDPDIVIFVLKTLTLILYYRVLYLIRYKAILWLSMLAFVLLGFLEFYLISMHLAIAFVLISIIYLLDGSKRKFFINYIIACFIHSSVLLFLPVIAIYFILRSNKYPLSRNKILLISIGCIVAFVSLTFFYNYAITTIPFFQQYAVYNLVTEYQGSGLMQYVYYVPILFFGLQIYKNEIISYRYKNIYILFSIFLFLFGLVGYKIEVFGRMTNYAIMIQMIFIPEYFYMRKTVGGFKGLFSTKVELFCWVMFSLFQGIITFLGKIYSETSQLDSWNFFSPF